MEFTVSDRSRASQDWSVPLRYIHDLWSRRKMSSEDAKSEALASRGMGCKKFMEVIDFTTEEETRLQEEAQVTKVQNRLALTLRPFRNSSIIDEFMEQFARHLQDPQIRYKILLMRGNSRSGKTQRAKALFGPSRTLALNCQGMSPDLPSIAGYDRKAHDAIVWDEIDEHQVLSNKVAFQSGVDPVTLGQSKCNQHAYRRWLHGVPMILCSNTFKWPGDCNHDLPHEDAQWLVENIFMAPVPASGCWYVLDGESSDEDLED